MQANHLLPEPQFFVTEIWGIGPLWSLIFRQVADAIAHDHNMCGGRLPDAFGNFPADPHLILATNETSGQVLAPRAHSEFSPPLQNLSNLFLKGTDP
jgi:hypothetical protein